MLANLGSFQFMIINNTAVNIFVWKSLSFFLAIIVFKFSHFQISDYGVKGGHLWSNRVNPNQVSLTLNSPIFNPNKEKWEWGSSGDMAGMWRLLPPPQSPYLPHPPNMHGFYYYYYYYYFWPCHIAWGILVPWPGVEPTPSAVEAWSLNHWNSKEVPHAWFLLLAVNKTLWVQPCHFWHVVTEGEENWKTPQQSWGAKVLGISCLDHEGETPCATSGKASQPWSTSYVFQDGQGSRWQSRGWHTPRAGAAGCGLAIKVHGQEPRR